MLVGKNKRASKQTSVQKAFCTRHSTNFRITLILHRQPQQQKRQQQRSHLSNKNKKNNACKRLQLKIEKLYFFFAKFDDAAKQQNRLQLQTIEMQER